MGLLYAITMVPLGITLHYLGAPLPITAVVILCAPLGLLLHYLENRDEKG